jgi:hypothetical protein
MSDAIQRNRVMTPGLRPRALSPGSREQQRLDELQAIIQDVKQPLEVRQQAIREAMPLQYENLLQA